MTTKRNFDFTTVIPAPAGFYIVERELIEIDGKEVATDFKTPIIGWVHGNYDCIFPATPFEVVTTNVYILFPNGEVSTYSSRWDSLSAWLADNSLMAQGA